MDFSSSIVVAQYLLSEVSKTYEQLLYSAEHLRACPDCKFAWLKEHPKQELETKTEVV